MLLPSWVSWNQESDSWSFLEIKNLILGAFLSFLILCKHWYQFVAAATCMVKKKPYFAYNSRVFSLPFAFTFHFLFYFPHNGVNIEIRTNLQAFLLWFLLDVPCFFMSFYLLVSLLLKVRWWRCREEEGEKIHTRFWTGSVKYLRPLCFGRKIVIQSIFFNKRYKIFISSILKHYVSLWLKKKIKEVITNKFQLDFF